MDHTDFRPLLFAGVEHALLMPNLSQDRENEDHYLIALIGASAGLLTALTEFLEALQALLTAF